MKIKICGMREADNIRELVSLKPDYIGFIFYKPSKRYIGSISEDGYNIPAVIKKTGVFVDAGIDEIRSRIEKYGLDTVQLHGSEPVELCEEVKKEGVEVIKAFGVDETFDFNSLNPYNNVVDFFLFDTRTKQYGGSGLSFEWEILKKYTLDKPYFLSGGLSLDNLSQVKDLLDNRLYAVDLNSRFETEPGLKDIEKLKEAFGLIRHRE